jgi:hypothetical protein
MSHGHNGINGTPPSRRRHACLGLASTWELYGPASVLLGFRHIRRDVCFYHVGDWGPGHKRGVLQT